MANLRRILASLMATATLTQPAQAAENSDTPAPAPAATQALAGMLDYYDALSPTDPPLVLLDADTLDGLDAAAPDFAGLARRIASDDVLPEAATLQRIFEALPRRAGAYGVNSGFAHETLPGRAILTSDTAGRTYCLVIGTDPDHDPAPAMAGLTTVQKVRFFNRHEFWHCAGNQMGARGGVDGHYAYVAEVLAEETRADLGALADMIAIDGDPPAVIGAVAAWRARHSGSRHRSHLTTPALLALATAIDSMGLDVFRTLGPAARRALCLQLATENALAGPVLAEIDRQQGLSLVEQSPAATADDAASAAHVLSLYARFARPGPEPDGTIRLTAAETAEALGWDAPARLAAAARQRGGVTRETLAAARVTLLDGLRAEVLAEPANAVHGARIVLLEAAYQQALATLRPAGPPPPAA